MTNKREQMSWAVGDWKEGLPTRALQKIQELQGQPDKLKKERQQRQLQLETLEAVLQKQTQKVENEEMEATALKKENQSFMEICENLEKAKQKISHEPQVKESQMNIQEGYSQLSSTNKQIEKLEQECKSYKSELERSQKAAWPADVSGSACNTPQKMFTTPITPSQYYSGSKYEDRKEKYTKEVEEQKTLKAEVKAMQAKKASQVIAQNTMKHLNISQHQASWSVFPWQQEQSSSPLPSDALQIPSRRGYSASHFSQELKVTPSSRSTLQVTQRGAYSSFCDNSSSYQLLDQGNAQNQELRSQAGELELRLPGHEKVMKVQVNQWPEPQLQHDKAKMELNEQENVLNKNRAKLIAQSDQASTKYTALEEKLKKLTEDLSLYQQNAESSRCSLEQKLKLTGKHFQEELSSQQRAFQILYRESSQVKGRLTQELQQAKNARNILQAELDKVTSGKHQLEGELEELKQQLGQTQRFLRESQTMEKELRQRSEEMKKENSFLKSQSEQSAREVCHLQEELKKTKQCLSQSQNIAEEMRAQNASQETMLRELQGKTNQQENSLTSEKLKLALTDLKKQSDGSQALFKEREHHIEQALQGRTDSCDTNRSEESALESKDRPSKHDLHLICDRDVQQDLSPRMQKDTNTVAVVPVGEGSQKQSFKEKVHHQEKLQSLIKDLQALSLGGNQQEYQIEQKNLKKEFLVRESESLQNNLRELEQEDLTVTKTLEAAGMQKGEVTLRLSSTQDKEHVMKNDMETLGVSTEADEKKRLEEMKGPDSKKMNLACQLQMARKHHEATVLHAEHYRAEVETLKSQIELVMEHLRASELDLTTIRSEKENLAQQLQEKLGQVAELDTSRSSLVHLLEAKEEENRNMQEEAKAAGEMLEKELKQLMKQVAGLREDSQARTFPEESSPVQRVQQLSRSISKLRDQLEDDDKKQFFVLAKLQETKHQVEVFKGEVDQLEKELKKAKKTQERATREAQSSKAEVEKLKAEIEETAPSLKDLRLEKEKLTKELQKARERIRELEQLKASFDNLSREKEQEIVRVKQESKLVQERLQGQLKDLKDKRPSLGDDQGTWKAREQGLSAQVAYLQLEKCQLLQGLDQARSDCITLQSSVNGLVQEVEDGKDKLRKREQEISLLKGQIQDQEQQVSKLSQRGEQPQNTKKQKSELESLTVQLEQKIRRLQSKNDTWQDTYKVLQNSYRGLQKELESIKMEKRSYVERVNSLISKETELQRKVHNITQKMTDLKEEFNGEKNKLTKQLNLMSEEMKHNEGQLKEFVLENNDLKRSLDRIHKHQTEKQEKVREKIAEYQRQLEEAEKRCQALLLDTNKQHEMEIQTYRDKLTSAEECLNSQKVEIDLLKSSKEQLSNSLKETTELLGELIKTKMDNQTHIKQLKKEKARAEGKIDFCLRHYKLMGEEMERLQKELCQLEEAVPEKQRPGALVDAHVDELMTEVKELKATLEGKSKEAEEYLDKYGSLLTSHEKLKRDKEMLEAQVAHLSSQQSPPNVQISPLLKSVAPESPPVPCVTEKKGSSSQSKASGKRQWSSGIQENKGGAAPSTPHTFPKRSRKAAKRGAPPAGDSEDNELEPRGLPEVQKEGPAVIPTGKTSPYLLRSTTMASRTIPRLAAQKLTRSLLNICKESHAATSQARAAGSGSQKVKVAQKSPSDSGTIHQDPSARPPSARPPSASKLRKRQWVGSPTEGLKSKRGCPAPSSEAGTKSRETCSIQ